MFPNLRQSINIKTWTEYCRIRFASQLSEANGEDNGDEIQVKDRAVKVKKVDIEVDGEGYPIWPTEDEDEPWNMPTRRSVFRNYLNAHYRKFA